MLRGHPAISGNWLGVPIERLQGAKTKGCTKVGGSRLLLQFRTPSTVSVGGSSCGFSSELGCRVEDAVGVLENMA